MITFRDLTANEIDCRVAQLTEKGLSLLLYKDARCDMNILDETVGADNWQREHYECKSNLFCRLGINVNFENPDLEPRWIWKSDCGAESNTEKQKGEASDSFKRAGFNWGIGRELYTAPFIWITPNNYTTKESKGKRVCRNNFVVTHIKIDNKKIVELVIFNEEICREVFWYGVKPKAQNKPQAQPQAQPQDSQIEMVTDVEVKWMVKLLKEKNITQKSVCDKFGVSSLRKLTMEQYEIVVNSLE